MILMNVLPTARNMQMEDSLETFSRCIPKIPDRKPVQHRLEQPLKDIPSEQSILVQ